LKQFYFLLVAFIAVGLMSGCSSKEYYEPEIVKEDWPDGGSIDEPIIDMTTDGALLENRQVLTTTGILSREMPEGYRYVSHDANWIVGVKTNGDLVLAALALDAEDVTFELQKTIAAASIKGDMLAVLFADNSMAIYSIASKELLFKEQGTPPVAVDNRIKNPYFLGELALFLTLDGKIVIVNTQAKTILQTIIVSTETTFNNIVYFNVIDNTMVAATPHKIFAMAEKQRRLSYDIRDAIFDADGVWVSTKQGELIALTPSLEEKAKLKFPFAHFLGMIATEEKVYLLEKEGYMIVADKDMTNYTVHEVDIEEGFVYVADKIFYFSDEYVTVK
jgi:hypothetical protein